jgi:predicted nucleic acid-binding protein
VPDLLFYELGNILRSKENFVSKEAAAILRETFGLALQIHLIDLLLSEEAFRFAREHDITFYDASFVALAHLLQASFITADKKLFAKVKTLPAATFLGSL